MIENFDIVDILRDYCNQKRFKLLYGPKDYQNALSDKVKYNPGDIIVFCDPIQSQPTFAGGRITENRFVLFIGVGRKCEASTRANLDETYLQKHDRRINELASILTTLISDISCQNQLDVANANYTLDINKFDLDADFVVANFTLVS